MMWTRIVRPQKGSPWHKPRSQDKKGQKAPIGPCYYDISSQSQPMYQMKPTTAFGSKQSRNSDLRFQNLKNNIGYIKKELDNKQYSFHQSQHTPGPGSYSLEVAAHRYKGAQPPFLISRSRFEEQVSETPTPGQYKVNNTMEQKLIQKLIKAPLGQFGVNENRFKEQKLLVSGPGPGAYEVNKIVDKKKIRNYQRKKEHFLF